MTTFLLSLDKLQQMLHLSDQVIVAAEDLAGRFETDFGSIQEAVRLGQAVNDVGCEVVALQSDDIDAPRSCRRSFDEHEGRYIVKDTTEAADKAEATHRREVMHRHASGNGRMVVHMDVSTEQRTIGHDDAIADAAVMGHMAIGHQEVIVADRRDAFFLFAGAIDRDAFANDVVVAYDNASVGAGVADVLGLATDDDIRVDHVVAPQRDVTHQRDIVVQTSSAADSGPCSNGAKGSNLDSLVNFSAWIDPRVGGDVGGHPRNPWGRRTDCGDVQH